MSRGITYITAAVEFIIHCNDDEYDYSFVTAEKKSYNYNDRKIIFTNSKKMLKIYEVKDKNLKNFITSKKGKIKDNNFSKMNTKFLVDNKNFIIEVYNNNK